MKKLLSVAILSLAAVLSYAQPQVIHGSWWGKISVGNQELAIGFDIKVEGDGTGSVLMDVPAQSVNGFEVGLKKASADSLEIDISVLGARYEGVRTAEDRIEGTFHQNGMSLKLDLQPGKVPQVERPQTPKKPYPYVTEEVTFENKAEGAVLSGTLTYPYMHFKYADGTIPVVLMVTGSGLQNRDEEVFGHKPFAVIANYLAFNGIASLRYDDRGIGGSTGPINGTTTLNNKADADAGIAYLRSLGKFGKIGVLGHSEGGTIAFMMGADDSVDFVVSLAGAAARGVDVLMGQNEAALKLSGVPEAIIDQYCRALEIIFNDRVSGSVPDDPAAYVAQICKDNSISVPDAAKGNLAAVVTSGDRWMDWFLAYDPSEAIRKITCPVFALNGTHDLQVLAKDNLPVVRENLPHNDLSVIKEYNSLNHLFQHCQYRDAMNYHSIDETISKEVLKDIADWINSVK